MTDTSAPRPHPCTYRILWTWDSWVCNPFSADSFTSEYRTLIDFAARTGYNALVIWGFLDSRHGGVEAATQVASYGASRGVRILPGVGAGGYHGYSITRGLPYNLEDFLDRHPACRAEPRCGGGPPAHLACLHRQETLDWLAEGARWLAQTFEIGGVNVETNEMDGICACAASQGATAAEPNRLRYAASFSDLSSAVPVIHDAVRSARPGAWVTYATYQPPWWERAEDNWLLQDIPATAIAQWNLEMGRACGPGPSVPENVALIHSGGWSYHLAAFPPTWAFTQYRCFDPRLQEAREFALGLKDNAVQGFALGNAGSPEMPDNEANYLAYLEFTRRPELTMAEFSRDFLAPLYGERAEGAVLKLMLAQPIIALSAAEVWRPLASLLCLGHTESPIRQASQELCEGLEAQIALAERAQSDANAEGARRLAAIRQVLREYLALAQMSRHRDLEPYRKCALQTGTGAAEAARRTASALAASNEVLGVRYQRAGGRQQP